MLKTRFFIKNRPCADLTTCSRMVTPFQKFGRFQQCLEAHFPCRSVLNGKQGIPLPDERIAFDVCPMGLSNFDVLFSHQHKMAVAWSKHLAPEKIIAIPRGIWLAPVIFRPIRTANFDVMMLPRWKSHGLFWQCADILHSIFVQKYGIKSN